MHYLSSSDRIYIFYQSFVGGSVSAWINSTNPVLQCSPCSPAKEIIVFSSENHCIPLTFLVSFFFLKHMSMQAVCPLSLLLPLSHRLSFFQVLYHGRRLLISGPISCRHQEIVGCSSWSDSYQFDCYCLLAHLLSLHCSLNPTGQGRWPSIQSLVLLLGFFSFFSVNQCLPKHLGVSLSMTLWSI